jgi:hypothetical protein
MYTKAFYALSIALLLVFSIASVLALPPVPPVEPGTPPDEDECTMTNGGIEICDSIDNDCDGTFDEDVCEEVPEDTGEEDDSGSSGSGGGSSGGGSGGGSDGSSGSSIIYFPSSSDTDSTQATPQDTATKSNGQSSTENENDVSSNDDSISESENLSSSDASSIMSIQQFISSNSERLIAGSAILLFVSLIAIFIFIKTHHHVMALNPYNSSSNAASQREVMASKYIAQMRSNNYSENDIKTAMKKSGWTDEQIDRLTKK